MPTVRSVGSALGAQTVTSLQRWVNRLTTPASMTDGVEHWVGDRHDHPSHDRRSDRVATFGDTRPTCPPHLLLLASWVPPPSWASAACSLSTSSRRAASTRCPQKQRRSTVTRCPRPPASPAGQRAPLGARLSLVHGPGHPAGHPRHPSFTLIDQAGQATTTWPMRRARSSCSRSSTGAAMTSVRCWRPRSVGPTPISGPTRPRWSSSPSTPTPPRSPSPVLLGGGGPAGNERTVELATSLTGPLVTMNATWKAYGVVHLGGHSDRR